MSRLNPFHSSAPHHHHHHHHRHYRLHCLHAPIIHHPSLCPQSACPQHECKSLEALPAVRQAQNAETPGGAATGKPARGHRDAQCVAGYFTDCWILLLVTGERLKFRFQRRLPPHASHQSPVISRHNSWNAASHNLLQSLFSSHLPVRLISACERGSAWTVALSCFQHLREAFGSVSYGFGLGMGLRGKARPFWQEKVRFAWLWQPCQCPTSGCKAYDLLEPWNARKYSGPISQTAEASEPPELHSRQVSSQLS